MIAVHLSVVRSLKEIFPVSGHFSFGQGEKDPSFFHPLVLLSHRLSGHHRRGKEHKCEVKEVFGSDLEVVL
jgi:hypothetical protein